MSLGQGGGAEGRRGGGAFRAPGGRKAMNSLLQRLRKAKRTCGCVTAGCRVCFGLFCVFIFIYFLRRISFSLRF